MLNKVIRTHSMVASKTVIRALSVLIVINLFCNTLCLPITFPFVGIKTAHAIPWNDIPEPEDIPNKPSIGTTAQPAKPTQRPSMSGAEYAFIMGQHYENVVDNKFRALVWYYRAFELKEPRAQEAIQRILAGVRLFEGHEEEITSIASCANSDKFVTASNDGKVKLWSREKAQPIDVTTFHGEDTDRITVVCAAMANTIAASRGRIVKIWDEGRLNKTPWDIQTRFNPVRLMSGDIALSQDGRKIVVRSMANIQTYDTKMKTMLFETVAYALGDRFWKGAEVTYPPEGVAISDDGSLVVAVTSNNGIASGTSKYYLSLFRDGKPVGHNYLAPTNDRGEGTIKYFRNKFYWAALCELEEFDAATGKKLRGLKYSDNCSKPLGISIDNEMNSFWISNNRNIHKIDMKTRKVITITPLYEKELTSSACDSGWCLMGYKDGVLFGVHMKEQENN